MPRLRCLRRGTRGVVRRLAPGDVLTVLTDFGQERSRRWPTSTRPNLWGSGRSWHYELKPASSGTDVHVSLNRVHRSFRGRPIGALIPLVGPRTLGRQLESVLRQAEAP